jgi:hypothetical protein
MDDHIEVYYPLESLIRSRAGADETLLDVHVQDALNATRRWFEATAAGRTFRPVNLDKRAEDLYVGLKLTGEVLLGHATPGLEVPTERPEPVSTETLVGCLKRLQKSVKLWNEMGGRRGYLEYISQFLPR